LKIKVDLWRTSLHSEEIGIKKTTGYRAKERKFTTDLDLFGKVEIDGEDYGLVGFRKKFWNTDDINKKTVDIRLFTSSISWIGTIEENIARTITLSLANDEILHAFNITLRGSKIFYTIEGVRPRFLSGEVFSLLYINEKNEVEVYLIRAKRVSLGSDWEVYEASTRKKIAKVDGKVLNFGGRWDIKLEKEVEENLINVLILFASTMRFYEDLKKRTEKLLEIIKKKKEKMKLTKSELTLLYNPKIRR